MRHSNQLQFGDDPNLVALRLAWDRTVNAMSMRVSKPIFESCVKPTVPLSFSDNRVALGAPSTFAQHWLEKKYLNSLEDLLSAHLGQSVKITVQLQPGCRDEDFGDESALSGSSPSEPVAIKKNKQPGFILNEQFSFDTFVVGTSNRLAHAAASAVAKAPGASYNPLFIYGGSGLGKTHLLQAIARFVIQFHPHISINYISAEAFTCDYVSAVTDRKTTQFRNRYRNVDLLLVDDIQFLAGKERTKEEFFHTFNALHEVGRQIVLSSDRPPKELELDPRLSSRFEAGLVVDVVPPDLETRMAIIHSKAETKELQIPHDVAMYIARLIRSNIRAIEGALHTLQAYAMYMHQPVSTEMATEILERYFEAPKESVVSHETVQALVAQHFGIPLGDLSSASREAQKVLARQVAMYLTREITQASLPQIGRVFGGKDHSTVLHAIKKVNKLVLQDPKIAEDIQRLMNELKNNR